VGGARSTVAIQSTDAGRPDPLDVPEKTTPRARAHCVLGAPAQRNQTVRLTLPALLAAALSTVVACSGSSPKDRVATTAPQPQAEDLFSNPCNHAFDVPAGSVAGVSTWSFYASASGVTVLGLDANMNVLADLVFLADETGTVVEGVGYALDSSLNVDGPTVVSAAMSDLHASNGSGPATQSLHVLDNSVPACGGLLQAMGAGTIEWAGILVGGAVMFLTCPESVGLGCIAGGAIIAGGLALGGAACNAAAQGQ
jgi:hypothetical protein